MEKGYWYIKMHLHIVYESVNQCSHLCIHIFCVGERCRPVPKGGWVGGEGKPLEESLLVIAGGTANQLIN